MINRWKHFCLTLSFLLLLITLAPLRAFAQFVDLQLDIESRITARTEHPLNFGTVTTDAGRAVISLGDTGMGVFSITGLKHHQIAVSLNLPEYLTHEDPALTAKIPADIRARYGFNSNQPRNSYSIPTETISLNIPETDPNTPWGKLYIFIFGALEVGDIPEGIYTEDILLHVEYL